MAFFSRRSARGRRLLIALAILGARAPSLRAADRYWINSAGGNFTGTANWSTTLGGVGGASVPTASDRAIFRIAGNPPIYTVNFPRSLQFPLPVYSMQQLRIDAQRVNFVDSGILGDPGMVKITDTSTNSTNRGLVLGELNGVAELHTTLAQFEAIAVRLGGVGSGRLYVEGGTFSVIGSSVTDAEVIVESSLHVINGGHMNVNGMNANVDVKGTLSISGAGSEMTVTGPLSVGNPITESASVTVGSNGLLSTTGATIQSGTIGGNAVNVGYVGIGGKWTNTGDLNVGGDLVLEGGTVTVGGELTIDGGTGLPAELRGQGIVNGDVVNWDIMAPLSPGGALHIEGNYTQHLGSKLLIEHYAIGLGRLEVSGNVTLDGDLLITLPPGMSAGDEYNVLDWGGTLAGTFSQVGVGNLPPELALDTANLYTTGVIRLVPKFMADFDLDADVDHQDLALWRLGLGTTGNATRLQGDSNGDLNVDGRDYLNWQRELGSDATPAIASGENVPEPAAWALWLMAAAMTWAPRRSQ